MYKTKVTVPDQELLNDIRWTIKEVEAYKLISRGYVILSNLPEINDAQANAYGLTSRRYASLAESCEALLQQLEEEKVRRNLI